MARTIPDDWKEYGRCKPQLQHKETFDERDSIAMDQFAAPMVA
jgi:hypothetical protein